MEITHEDVSKWLETKENADKVRPHFIPNGHNLLTDEEINTKLNAAKEEGAKAKNEVLQRMDKDFVTLYPDVQFKEGAMVFEKLKAIKEHYDKAKDTPEPPTGDTELARQLQALQEELRQQKELSAKQQQAAEQEKQRLEFESLISTTLKDVVDPAHQDIVLRDALNAYQGKVGSLDNGAYLVDEKGMPIFKNHAKVPLSVDIKERYKSYLKKEKPAGPNGAPPIPSGKDGMLAALKSEPSTLKKTQMVDEWISNGAIPEADGISILGKSMSHDT